MYGSVRTVSFVNLNNLVSRKDRSGCNPTGVH